MLLARFLLVSALLLWSTAANAAGDAFRMLASENEVLTAGRRVQAAGEAPAAVDVITAEEIDAMGARSLCEVMRFRAGMDVVDGRNVAGSGRCVISVRGFARDQVTELLVVIDGRNAYSPLGGTILWEQLPVQLQDIQRIEILRGPNAALYGSGAGLGVINIITKEPAKNGLKVQATGGSLDSNRVESAATAVVGPAAFRLSHTHREQYAYPSATSTPANDFINSEKGNARFVWHANSSTQLDLLAGGSWDEIGKAVSDKGQGRFRSDFQRAQLSHAIDEDSVVQFAVSRAEQYTTHDPDPDHGIGQTRFYMYDLEGLHSFGWLDESMHTTWGGFFRTSKAESNYIFGAKGSATGQITRGYLHQTAVLAPWARLVGGVSVEVPYGAGTEHVDYQGALLLGKPKEHVLRFSYARAHTNPGLDQKFADFTAGGGFVQVMGSPNIQSYKLENWETGYHGLWLDERLTTKVSYFYTHVGGHTNLETDTNVFPVQAFYSNSNDVYARGVEVEAQYKIVGVGHVFANYTYEIVTDRDAHQFYIKTTPANKANLGGLARYGRFTLWTAAGYKDGYLADSIQGTDELDIPAFWRLDARVSFAATSWLDVFVSGKNLLAPRHPEYIDQLLVPRVFEGGVKVKFR